MSKNDRHNDAALRMALQREQSRIRLPEGLTEKVMEKTQQTQPRPAPLGRGEAARWFLALAALLVLGLFILVPRLRESRSLAIYEGSYVIENGQRQDDLQLIKSDISEALSMADQAELLSRE